LAIHKYLGMKEGFVITSINKKKVFTATDVQKALENKTSFHAIAGSFTLASGSESAPHQAKACKNRSYTRCRSGPPVPVADAV